MSNFIIITLLSTIAFNLFRIYLLLEYSLDETKITNMKLCDIYHILRNRMKITEKYED